MFTVYETLTGRIIATDVTLTQAYGIRDAQRAYYFARPQHAVRIAPAKPSDREGGTRSPTPLRGRQSTPMKGTP